MRGRGGLRKGENARPQACQRRDFQIASIYHRQGKQIDALDRFTRGGRAGPEFRHRADGEAAGRRAFEAPEDGRALHRGGRCPVPVRQQRRPEAGECVLRGSHHEPVGHRRGHRGARRVRAGAPRALQPEAPVRPLPEQVRHALELRCHEQHLWHRARHGVRRRSADGPGVLQYDGRGRQVLPEGLRDRARLRVHAGRGPAGTGAAAVSSRRTIRPR